MKLLLSRNEARLQPLKSLSYIIELFRGYRKVATA